MPRDIISQAVTFEALRGARAPRRWHNDKQQRMSSKLEARVAQHDREIATIRKLILTGMRMLNRLEHAVGDLTAAQRKTDQMLQDLINVRLHATRKAVGRVAI